MWAFSLIPENWKSKGNDLLWFLVLIAAVITTTTLVWKLKWLRPTLRWIAQRPWSKEITEHADGTKTVVVLTPIVKRERRLQQTMQPMIALVLDKIGDLEASNTVQHSLVESRLAELTSELATMSEEMVTMKAGWVDLSERMAAVETALMNHELRGSSG